MNSLSAFDAFTISRCSKRKNEIKNWFVNLENEWFSICRERNEKKINQKIMYLCVVVAAVIVHVPHISFFIHGVCDTL